MAGEAVLLDLEGRRILGLNAVGSVVWTLLDGRRTGAEIAAEIASRFGVPGARAAADVLAFLSQLAARGLVSA